MILKYIRLAWRGRCAWLNLCRAHALDEKSFIGFMPDDDSELNACALRHIRPYMERKLFTSAALLVASYGTEYETEGLDDMVDIIVLPPEVISLILYYYRLVAFRPRMKVISLREPYGSRGLLKKEAVDMDYIINNYIYR